MSEEIEYEEEALEEEQHEEQEEQEAGGEEQLSEVEQEAMKHGWNPEGVEGKRNLSAEEFMDRQKFFDDIRSLKRQNKNLQEQFEALQKHHKDVRQKERTRVIEELKAKKKLAYESEDFDSVVDIDEQLQELKNEKEEDDSAAKEASNPIFEKWVERNSWYEDDSELREQADILGHGFMAAGRGTPEQAYEYVEKQIKKMYPDKFSEGKRAKPSAVEKGSRGTKKPKGSKYSEKDLPEEDRKIMQTILRSGAITKEQFLKDYFGE